MSTISIYQRNLFPIMVSEQGIAFLSTSLVVSYQYYCNVSHCLIVYCICIRPYNFVCVLFQDYFNFASTQVWIHFHETVCNNTQGFILKKTTRFWRCHLGHCSHPSHLRWFPATLNIAQLVRNQRTLTLQVCYDEQSRISTDRLFSTRSPAISFEQFASFENSEHYSVKGRV